MAKQVYTTGQILTAAQMTTLQANDYNQTVSAKTANYVLVAADAGTRITMNSASATTVTVNTSIFAAGDTLEITNIGAGVLTVTAGTATVSTSSTLALKQFDSGTLYFTSTGVAIFFASDAADGATLGANTFTADQVVNGLIVGRGSSNISTNTVFGTNAFDTNTTGTDSVAIGYNALTANTTGIQNTAVGEDALANNTTGFLNTAVGLLACSGINTGQSNSGFGIASLSQCTNGGYNTAVGRDAGYSLTTGTNNSFFGYLSTPSSATVSNTITLGNTSIATLRCQVTSITSLSDKRDKTDIMPLKHGLDFVKQLKPVSFEWNTRPETRTDVEGNEIEMQGKVGVSDIGFIAQDIVALEDSLDAGNSLQLSYRDNPEKLEVTQGRLIPILVKAIQDLSAKVEILEASR